MNRHFLGYKLQTTVHGCVPRPIRSERAAPFFRVQKSRFDKFLIFPSSLFLGISNFKICHQQAGVVQLGTRMSSLVLARPAFFLPVSSTDLVLQSAFFLQFAPYSTQHQSLLIPGLSTTFVPCRSLPCKKSKRQTCVSVSSTCRILPA